MKDEDDETKQVAIRFPVRLLERIDEHAARMKRAHTGRLSITRADAVRSLLADALDQAEADSTPKKTSKS